MRPVLLSSAYLAPVQYYTKLYGAPYCIEERADHYMKQSYRNRCLIAGPQGALALTIPVVHEGKGRTVTGEIRISSHGNWKHLHWQALVSAYENSPYFEEYAEDFRKVYEEPYERLCDLNAAFRDTICGLLDLHPDIRLTASYADPAQTGADDFRESIHPKRGYEGDEAFRPVPYYQVFSERNGFLPNLSMVDLLFNMGPESRLVLRDSIVRR